MAKLSGAKKIALFKELNSRKLPWKDAGFVIRDDDYIYLGGGNFSEVYEMESYTDPQKKYAVKIIGLSDSCRVHDTDVDSYKKEPIIQIGLSEMCDKIVSVSGAEVISVKYSDDGIIEEIRDDEYGVHYQGWLVLIMIRMEKLTPVVEQSFSGDYYFTNAALTSADENEVLKVATDIAEALVHSHKVGILHRDVKLENIFYDAQSGIYKLGDFGIARLTQKGNSYTVGAGTSGYKAPEVDADNENSYDFAADIYSFGVTIYLILNELRFPGSSGYYVNSMAQYSDDAQIDMPLHGSEALKDYVLKMMAYSPKNRPESMEKILVDLRKIREENYVKAIAGKSEVSSTEMIEQPETKPEAKLETRPEKNINPTSEKADRNERQLKKPIVPKGIVGGLLLVAGILMMVLFDTEKVSLSTDFRILTGFGISFVYLLAAFISRYVRLKKFPYWPRILIIGYMIFAMATGGANWLALMLTIMLLVCATSADFFVSVSSLIAMVIMKIPADKMILNPEMSKYIWIPFLMIILGILLLHQFDEERELIGVILSSSFGMVVVGVFLVIAGLVIFILSKIPAVGVNQVLLNLKLPIEGGICIVIGLVLTLIE